MEKSETISIYAALIAAIVFWGLSFVATKIALTDIPPFTLVFARFSIASAFFAIMVLKRGFPRFSGKDRRTVLLTALFEPCLYFVFETMGLKYTSAPKASLIIATIPLAVLALAWLLLGEKAKPASIAGIFLSLGGIWLLVAGDPLFEWNLNGALRGDLLVFGAVVSAALYIVLAHDLGKRHSSMDITAMQTFYGALFFSPAFLYELPAVQWTLISWPSLAALAYLTVFATVAAFLCYNFALTKIPAPRASVFINGIPLVTAAGAWVLLGESLGLVQGIGGLLILAAVAVAGIPDLKKARTSNRQR